MEAEPGADRVQSELAEVRYLLDTLVARRLDRPLSAMEQDEFDRLVEHERNALDVLARRRTSAGDSPTDDGA
jgi:hypothetical protein